MAIAMYWYSINVLKIFSILTTENLQVDFNPFQTKNNVIFFSSMHQWQYAQVLNDRKFDSSVFLYSYLYQHLELSNQWVKNYMPLP